MIHDWTRLPPFKLLAVAILLLAAACERGRSGSDSASARLPGPWNLPSTRNGPVPELLSETGIFQDLQTLSPHPALIEYDINVPFWSDWADKKRWMWVPPGRKIRFSPADDWEFPDGALFIKHFDMPTDESRPEVKKRLETRIIIRETGGGVFGIAYKWRDDGSDADLIVNGSLEEIPVQTSAGTQSRKWYFPDSFACLQCHTPLAGYILGASTRQLNRDYPGPDGAVRNQLDAWGRQGLLAPRPDPGKLASYPRLAAADDHTRSLEDRARSYLDSNCGYCHRPDGAPGNFDARYQTPLSRQNLINGPVLIDLGIDHARSIAPGDERRSLILQRVNTLKLIKMPPLARESIDHEGVALLREWIASLPASPVPKSSSPAPAEESDSAPSAAAEAQEAHASSPRPH